MCLAQFGDVIAEEPRHEPETVLDRFLWIRSVILNVSPMFKVPLEAHVILFFLVNVYKGVYVTTHMSRRMRAYFAAFTTLALALEMPVEGEFTQIWAATALGIILPIPMVFNRTLALVLTSIFICFSQPLALYVDFCLLIYALARVESNSTDFENHTIWYFLVCNVISAFVNWQVTTHGLTMLAMSLIALYFLATVLYLSVFGLFYYHRQPLMVIVSKYEVVIYMMFPLLFDIFYKNYYGEMCTYSFQYFKSL